jgi:asparagine synthase (glutamine-hydrolysing)
MCGIAGIFCARAAATARHRSELRRSSEHMALRGPDASGEWWSDDGAIGLAHRRLSIIDLDSQANQPMSCNGGALAIVFNGEIYNYRELRHELIAAGRTFITQSDTEVLLQAYDYWGEAALNRLRGMYAFAIWDDRRKRLFLARDPYGIKPLYYSTDGNTFRFASQVKALLAGGAVSREPSPCGVAGFLMMGSVPEPYTVYRDISAVPAGCYLYVDESGAGTPQQYFSIAATWQQAAANPVFHNANELQELVTTALVESVKHHTIADVPVGVFLSAGIDSGTLLALMREQQAAPVQSITLGFLDFKGSQNDETLLADQVARHYGSSHTTHWVEDAQVEHDLPGILSAMDQPSVDGVNTWLVSKAAHDAGLKVVLSGVGGDELFGGYTHFDTLPRWKSELHLMYKVPGLPALGASALSTLSRLGLVPPKAAAVARYGNSYAGLYLARRGLFMPWELPELLGDEFSHAALATLQPPAFIASSIGVEPAAGYAAVAALEANFYLRNQLLRDSDWASMAHSLELRTPFVDAKLLGALAPSLVHRPDGMQKKTPLANAPNRTLPNNVLHRPKTGFSLPMGRWLEKSNTLDGWRDKRLLVKPGCHWSRQMAYCLVKDILWP